MKRRGAVKDRELMNALKDPASCECPTTPDPRQGDRVRQPNARGSHCLWCGLELPRGGGVSSHKKKETR